MKRRLFLAAVLTLLPSSVALAASRNRFVFKIRTKNGNIAIEAKYIEEAKHKLENRHPDCKIFEGHEK